MKHSKKQRSIFSWTFSMCLVLSLVIVPGVIPAVIAAPGDQLFHIAGELDPGALISPLYPWLGSEDKPVNLKARMSGGSSMTLQVVDGGGGTALDTSTILEGETLWTTIVLKPGNNRFTLTNPTGNVLAYELWLYEIDMAPYAWEGLSVAGGAWQSEISLNFPTSGLYEFELVASTGRYQFYLDEAYIQKTVESTETVGLFVPAGDHALKVMSDSGVGADWRVAVSGPGAATDTLPYAKSGGELGGTGNDFDTEWLPLNLGAAVEANFALTVTGDSADALSVYLYGESGGTAAYSVTEVHGGETVWWTTGLPSGTSRVKVAAEGGNGDVLSYELEVYEKPVVAVGTPAAWSGLSAGGANDSEVRFAVAEAGLYDLTYGVEGGRYQFVIGSEAQIQKTAESSGEVQYYLETGDHTLQVVADGALGAEWTLSIASAGIAADTLPYEKTGGELGGTGNDFDTEWMPLALVEGETANLSLTLTGDLADGLRVSLYAGAGETPVYTTPVVYGGETFWWTTDLVAGVNRIKVEAEGGNAAPLGYEFSVLPVSTVLHDTPHGWGGASLAAGGQSEIELQVPVAGTYHVELLVPTGMASVYIDRVVSVLEVAPQQTHIEYDVPLSEGGYLFRVGQDVAYPRTTWAVTVSMKNVPAPQITSVSPVSVTNDVTSCVTILGANFQPDPTIELVGATTVLAAAVERLDSTTLHVWIARGTPLDTYDLAVTNPDGKSDTLPDALWVRQAQYDIYLPIVFTGGG